MSMSFSIARRSGILLDGGELLNRSSAFKLGHLKDSTGNRHAQYPEASYVQPDGQSALPAAAGGQDQIPARDLWHYRNSARFSS